jgi:hypothetical protein
MPTRKTFLFLFSAALGAVLLLAACGSTSTTSNPPVPTATPSPLATSPTTAASATPFCGLDVTHPLAATPFTVSDPTGLRTQTPAGQQAFNAQVKAVLLPYTRLTAGLVEVFAGGADSASGEDFALAAIQALNLLADQQFVFSHKYTYFQSFWDGSLSKDQIRLQIVFYQCGG